MSEESARGMLLNLMAEWRMTTGHGSRTWADRILRRHRNEVADQLGRELLSAGIEPFVRRLVGDANADDLWRRHAGEDGGCICGCGMDDGADRGAAEDAGQGLGDHDGPAAHDTHGCTGAWEVVGAFGRRCADCKTRMAPLVPPVDVPEPEGEVWTRSRCGGCNHTASGVRVIFAPEADDAARESIHQLLKQRGYFKEDE